MEKNKKPSGLWTLLGLLVILFMIGVTAYGCYLLYTQPMFGFRYYLIGLIIVACLLLSAIILKPKKKTWTAVLAILIGAGFGGGITYCDLLYSNAIKTIGSITTDKGDIAYSHLCILPDQSYSSLEDLKDKRIAVGPSYSQSMYQAFIDELNKEDSPYKESDFILSPYANSVEAYVALTNGQVDAILVDDPTIETIEETYPNFNENTKEILTLTTRLKAAEASDLDLSQEPFTILINGVDIRSGDLNEIANADVIMLATFNPKTMKLSLNSIPRDTYLPVTCRGFNDKVTHSGEGGVDCTIDTLERVFNIDIDYYVKVNFRAVVALVDALGGIEVDVPSTFDEQDQWDWPDNVHLEKGWHTLNGEQALALARHRKTLERGDIDRGLNQQLVIEGIIRKVASAAGLWNVDSLLKVVGSNVQTNMPTKQMYSLFNLLTKITSESKYGNLSMLSISKHTVDGYGDMRMTGYFEFPLYFYIPYDESLDDVTRDINQVLGKEEYPFPEQFAFNANILFEDISDESLEALEPENIESVSYNHNYFDDIYYEMPAEDYDYDQDDNQEVVVPPVNNNTNNNTEEQTPSYDDTDDDDYNDDVEDYDDDIVDDSDDFEEDIVDEGTSEAAESAPVLPNQTTTE